MITPPAWFPPHTIMHLWTCNIPFANTNPPTGIDAIANEDTLFAESAGVEGMPDPEVLAKAWARRSNGEEVCIVPREFNLIRVHCKQPDDAPKILSRFLRNNRKMMLTLGNEHDCDFWMDLTCAVATIRLRGCRVIGLCEEGRTTIFSVLYSVYRPVAPKSDF